MGSPLGYELHRRQPGGEWRVLAAVLVVLATGFGVAVLSICALFASDPNFWVTFDPSPKPSYWPTVGFALGAGVVFVGGLWCAWRVGTGRWGLRRRPTPDAEDGKGGR